MIPSFIRSLGAPRVLSAMAIASPEPVLRQIYRREQTVRVVVRHVSVRPLRRVRLDGGPALPVVRAAGAARRQHDRQTTS